MKLCPALLCSLAIMMIGCATDPLIVHQKNWTEVTRTLSSYTPSFKECKKGYSEKMNESNVIYTFNISKDTAKNILTFNDPYKLPDDFHQCIVDSLSSIKFKLDETEELRNGYLLINKNVEKFNYVIY